MDNFTNKQKQETFNISTEGNWFHKSHPIEWNWNYWSPAKFWKWWKSNYSDVCILLRYEFFYFFLKSRKIWLKMRWEFQQFHRAALLDANLWMLDNAGNNHACFVKGAWSEIFGEWTFFNADMVTFPTKTSSIVKHFANIYLICKQFEKAMLMLLIVL